MFKISRNDSDILVISNNYIDELRSLPDEELSAIRAHTKVSCSQAHLFNEPKAKDIAS